jgi:hypothetical protein
VSSKTNDRHMFVVAPTRRDWRRPWKRQYAVFSVVYTLNEDGALTSASFARMPKEAPQ